jgi:UDP-N-acetylglucosamine 2-epimerase (non-hydrolysing)
MPERFGLVTLHRPANVDDPSSLQALWASLSAVSASLPLFFPVHPRTSTMLNNFGLKPPPGLHLLAPLGYVEFLGLMLRTSLVITDSGGVQEETSYLKVPCITLRQNTERPVTITLGTNILTPDVAELPTLCAEILARPRPNVGCIPLWDGRTAERIAAVILP